MYFHYHAKKFYSAKVGNRINEIQCDGCGTQYFYQLTRVGFGSASAPYGLGAEAAKLKAAQKAQNYLEKRLATDAELVPCPKCNWVSDGLIRAYRAGRYRSMTVVALTFGFIGTSVGIFFFLMEAARPRPNLKSTTIEFVLFISVGIVAALSIVGIRYFLRLRIQPNATHPSPPILPLGTPPALVRNPAGDRFEIAQQQPLPVESNKNWTLFLIGRNGFPLICSECLHDCSMLIMMPLGWGLSLALPTCDFCRKARKWHSRIRGITAAILVPAAALAVLPFFRLDQTAFLVILLSACAVGPLLGLVVAGIVNQPARARVVDAARGVVRLRFRNDEFCKHMTVARV
jgi:hypothetical protein